MSSATSTNAIPAKAAIPPGGGSYRDSGDDGFRVSHFFVLLSLVAATVAVVMARPAAPENLVLISLTIGAAGVASLAFYRTIAPLVAPGAWGEGEPLSDSLRADLEREKALTLRSIKELEFDRAMGKLSDQDFEVMAGRLRARAMGIMKQLEAGTSMYRQEIEKELAARLGKTSKPDPKIGRAASRPSVTCACGTANDPDARFCKNCGARLAESAR
jgi:zinc ribbon protein